MEKYKVQISPTPSPIELKQWRESRHLTQKEAANAVGVSSEHWCRWERGKHRIHHMLFTYLREWDRANGYGV